MKQISLKLMVFLLALILLPSISAQLGIPHQFWGDVSYNDASAPDGLSIEAKIDGVTVKESTTLSGRYGYDPIFIITDPNEGREGKTIVFYVNNVEAASFIFGNGKTTELSLAVNGPVISGGSPPTTSSGGGGGSGGSSGGGSSGGGGGGGGSSNSGSSVIFLSDSTNNAIQNNTQELNFEVGEDKETEETTKLPGIIGGVIGNLGTGGIVAFIIIALGIMAILITKRNHNHKN